MKDKWIKEALGPPHQNYIIIDMPRSARRAESGEHVISSLEA
jgi:hypothetical protein